MIFVVIIFYVLTFLFTFLLGGIQQATGLDVNLSIPPMGTRYCCPGELTHLSKEDP